MPQVVKPMIWSPSRKFCFIHISKTGGTSIEEAYTPHIRFGDVVLAALPDGIDRWYGKAMSAGKHSSAHHISRLAGKSVFEEMLSIAVVRDPLERMVSYYRWIHSYDHRGERERGLKETADFSEFTEKVATFMLHQTRMVCDHKSGEKLVKFLIPFPKISEGWNQVAAVLKIDSPLPHVNASQKKIMADVSSEARQRVFDIFADDVQLFETALRDFPIENTAEAATQK
jgi:hypothetical protein